MNLKQFQYIVSIAEYKNISRAAESLFISRSALNEYLLQMEQELGTPLFQRLKRQLIPTYAGEIYLAAARKILLIQEQLEKEIHEIADESTGRINIGINRSIGEKIFRETFPVFHQTFPNHTIQLTSSEALDEDLMEGKVDWAIMGYGSAKPMPPDLEQMPLDKCEIVLALPQSHPLAQQFPLTFSPLPAVDLNLLKNDKFILLKPGVNARLVADAYFKAAGFEPDILMECNGGMIASQMVKDGIGPTILVETLVNNDARVRCFSLNPKAYWTHSIAFRKGTIFSKAENYYIDLIRQYLQNGIPKN